MATLYVTEFRALGFSNPNTSWGAGPAAIQAAAELPAAEQTVAISGSSAASGAFNATTTLVRLHTDSICSVKFSASGSTPTATTSTMRMAADQTEYFVVSAGMKVAVIANT